MEDVIASAIVAEPTAEALAEPKPARAATKAKSKASKNKSSASRVGSAPAASAKSEVYGPPAPAAAEKLSLRWNDDDEADLRALLARRKAAGYRKPSRDVGGQIIKLGRISPNPNTVAASVVALVGLKGEMTRRDLIADMADCTFPHPKAQPKDPQWCTGYISGCVRNAFLEIVLPAEGNQ